MFSVKFGKGVLDKWGQEPFAANTLFGTRLDDTGREMKSPYTLSYVNVGKLLNHDPIREVQIIDADNNQIIIRKVGPDVQQARSILFILKGMRNGMSRMIGMWKRTTRNLSDEDAARLPDYIERRDQLNVLIKAMEEML